MLKRTCRRDTGVYGSFADRRVSVDGHRRKES